MLANRFGSFWGITSFGESHGPAVGVVIEDIKPGIEFPFEEIQAELDRRRPGKGKFSSSRKEMDKLQVMSGIFQGKTTGMPICILVYNTDARSEDYQYLQDIFRPGHADLPYFKKFKIYDYRGGGRASGRETIARVAAGALVNNLLGDIEFISRPVKVGTLSLEAPAAGESVTEYLQNLEVQGDSTGSIVEMIITNVSSGLGDPVFEKLDANIAKALLSIGGIKGIEFGEGFRLGSMTGSRANDQIDSTGYLSNHAGGITGGISTGQDIILRYVIKPPASIRQPQHTINHHGDDIVFTNKGRFDTWLAPRIIPVAEAMVKLVLADAISYQKLLTGCNPNLSDLREAVDKIDEDILIALYRRREFAKRIGLLKKENGLPIKDDTRESAIIKELISKADTWGLDPELVKKLWDIILDFSRKQQ